MTSLQKETVNRWGWSISFHPEENPSWRLSAISYSRVILMVSFDTLDYLHLSILRRPRCCIHPHLGGSAVEGLRASSNNIRVSRKEWEQPMMQSSAKGKNHKFCVCRVGGAFMYIYPSSYIIFQCDPPDRPNNIEKQMPGSEFIRFKKVWALCVIWLVDWHVFLWEGGGCCCRWAIDGSANSHVNGDSLFPALNNNNITLELQHDVSS